MGLMTFAMLRISDSVWRELQLAASASADVYWLLLK